MNRHRGIRGLCLFLGVLVFARAPLAALEDFSDAAPSPNAMPAAASGLGLGFTLGEPSGINCKLWFSDVDALEAQAAFSFYRRTRYGEDYTGAFYFYLDYMRHFFDMVKPQRGKLVYAVGVGLEAALTEDFYFGVRLPISLSYMFERLPLDVFATLAPSVVFIPGISSDMSMVIGTRYWF